MKRTREWNTAYARLRAARQRYSLLVLRLRLGLDLSSGATPVEVVRLQQLRAWLYEAQFAVAAKRDHMAIEDDFNITINEIATSLNAPDSSAEFKQELSDLLADACAAQDSYREQRERG